MRQHIPKNAVWLIGDAPSDPMARIAEEWLAPSFAAGDAQFFHVNPRELVQLRPILKSEEPKRNCTPSDRMLVAFLADGRELRAFVRVKFGCRENTPRNVRRAIGQLLRFQPDLGALMLARFNEQSACSVG